MTKFSFSTFILIFLCCFLQLKAQLPETELFMLELNSEQEVSNVSYLSGFNSNAYNNQAVFISDTKILLTSEIDAGQTDIVQLDLEKHQWKRLTATSESEYSPRLNGDYNFTSVRVEKDSESQTLWEYPLHLKDSGTRLLPNAGTIGYYYFLPNFKIALFIIEEDTFKLKVGNLRNNVIQEKFINIGRCFQANKKGELLFVDKSKDKNTIKSYNVFNQQVRDIAPGLSDSEDFIIFGNNEEILMAKGPQIFSYKPSSNIWILRFDLSEYGLNKITRMDIRGNKILVINIK